jgi:hypothetical protein
MVGVLLEDFVKEFELLYGQQHVTYNIHLLTHLSKSVLDWGCLWSTSTFIPEWFNGQLQGLTNVTQAVIEQMASLYLMKNSVRNQALCLFQNRTAVPLNIFRLISKIIFLPINYQFKNLKNLNVSGKPVLRKLSLDEQSIVENILLQQTEDEINDKDREKIVKKIENNACAFYRRLEFKSPCNSIFTTAAYVRSKKRINYCALLEDGRFFLMESVVYVDEAMENFKVLSLVGPWVTNFDRYFLLG